MYIQGVPEFMDQTLRVGKIHTKKHFLYSNVGLEIKSVRDKTENAEVVLTINTSFKLSKTVLQRRFDDAN